MPRYVRAYVPGAHYFFTVAILERRQRLLTDNINALREAFRAVRRRRPFRIEAVVVLPDHLHCIWTLPQGETDFSTRWRLIKGRFSRAINTKERQSQSRIRKHERGIWQRRFWEHVIRDERDLAAHIDYIHYNPVRHGWVKRVMDWPHSSFHRFVRLGIYPTDWALADEFQVVDWTGKGTATGGLRFANPPYNPDDSVSMWDWGSSRGIDPGRWIGGETATGGLRFANPPYDTYDFTLMKVKGSMSGRPRMASEV